MLILQVFILLMWCYTISPNLPIQLYVLTDVGPLKMIPYIAGLQSSEKHIVIPIHTLSILFHGT